MPEAICLTIGDPSGIGPEITIKLLQHLALGSPPREKICIIGDVSHLLWTAQSMRVSLPEADWVEYVNLQASGLNASAKSAGQIAYDSLEAAVERIHRKEANILATGPISKENLQEASIAFSGHTEILQHLARRYYKQPCQSDMLFLYKRFRMLLLTRHVPLRKVHETLSVRGVMQSLDNLIQFLNRHERLESPRLCLLGVNPHAGELEGEEEERILNPAIKLISEKHQLAIAPPVAADAAFRGFDVNRVPYDAYVAAYHDQGLIPFKMVAGLKAVNVTIGLPFLRTSVSHGTAPDIAGQGIADPESLMEAYQLARRLASTRQETPVPAV